MFGTRFRANTPSFLAPKKSDLCARVCVCVCLSTKKKPPLMRLPAVHLIPSVTCASSECIATVLRDPPVARLPVVDDLGIEYAFDLQLTEGAYVLLLFGLLWSVVRPLIVRRRD